MARLRRAEAMMKSSPTRFLTSKDFVRGSTDLEDHVFARGSFHHYIACSWERPEVFAWSLAGLAGLAGLPGLKDHQTLDNP